MNIFNVILFLSISMVSYSQTDTTKEKKPKVDKPMAVNGGIEIVKDSRIDDLIKKQAYPLNADGIPQIPGYRVQLLFDSDKKKVDEMRARFISMNPNIETYVVYNAPNYLLKAGDCRTYVDAEKIRDASRRTFPASFIVREMVKLPKID
ncbi:MAG: hypothetical protein ACSHXL_04690 [Bacteroidota bacterium]